METATIFCPTYPSKVCDSCSLLLFYQGYLDVFAHGGCGHLLYYSTQATQMCRLMETVAILCPMYTSSIPPKLRRYVDSWKGSHHVVLSPSVCSILVPREFCNLLPSIYSFRVSIPLPSLYQLRAPFLCTMLLILREILDCGLFSSNSGYQGMQGVQPSRYLLRINRQFQSVPTSSLYQVLVCTKFQSVPSSSLYQVLVCTKFYSVPSSSLYQVLVCTKFQSVPSSSLYQVLVCTKFQFVPSSSLQQVLVCTKFQSVPSSSLQPSLS